MSNVIQKSIDRFWQLTFFRFLPISVTPNFFTAMRFICIPFIILAIAMQDFGLAFYLFIFSALSDSLDGSLARCRKVTTPAGAFYDIVADKLLNIFILTFLAVIYPAPWLLFLVVMFDLLTLFGSLFLNLALGRKDFKSDFFGKIKVTVEMLGVILVLIAYAFNFMWLINFSIWLFILLLMIEIVSLAVYWLKTAFGC